MATAGVETTGQPGIAACQPRPDFIASSPPLHDDAATIRGGHEAHIHHVRGRAIPAQIPKPDFPGIALFHQFFDVGGSNRRFMQSRRCGAGAVGSLVRQMQPATFRSCRVGWDRIVIEARGDAPRTISLSDPYRFEV